MKIKTIAVKNFKSFDMSGVYLSLNELTALVGENSSGKSNILEALDIFFNYTKGKIKKESFHHENFSHPIEIELTFFQLKDEEKERFQLHLGDDNESLTITQRIMNKTEEQENESEETEEFETASELNIIESKHGSKWTVPDEFEWLNCLDKQPTKTNLSKWWKLDLKVDGIDLKSFFPSGQPSQEEYQKKVKELWNNGKLPKKKITGDDKVLGWKGILKGNLPKYFYIPALKDINDDLKVSKTSPFGTIISYLTNEIGKELKDELVIKTKTFMDEIIAKIDLSAEGKSKIEEINKALNKNIGIDIDCNLNLQFTPPNIDDLILPKLFGDDGFNSELVYKGHGIQRLAIFALLRTYYQYKNAKAGASGNFIIGIEEPEIYLHPPVKRSTYSFFRTLSESGTQVIYTTHDSYFIKVENFDEIRIFRKETNLNSPVKTNVYEFSIQDMIEYYKRVYKNNTINEKSLRHRFYHICDESKNEGFFAKKVILIEGETERYALPIYFKAKGFDLDAHRVAIINAGSVAHISYLLVMFNEFKIPCYIIFDGDKPTFDLSKIPDDKKSDIKNKSKRNKELFSYVGEEIPKEELFFPETRISKNMAVWETDFESVFHKSLEKYDEIKDEAKHMYSSDSKPLTGRFFAEKICNDFSDLINPKIDELIEKIKNCQWEQFIIKK